MPEHYQYEEYHRRRRERDDSPEYYSGGGGGGGGGGARPYDPDYRPFDSSPRVNEPPYPRDTLRLEPPPSNARPRSVPPPNTAVIHRPRARSPSVGSSRSSFDRDDQLARRRDRSPSPISKARNAVQDNFTNSTAGIGAGLLGAVVGGLVARQASDAVSRHRNEKDRRRRRSGDYDDDGNTTRVVSTILGAVAGGLGANALTNRFEDSRDRDRAHQHAWERRHGREEDLPHYDTGKPGDLDHRNGRGLRRDSDDDYDYVYDDPRYDDRRPRRRRSEDDVRYRP